MGHGTLQAPPMVVGRNGSSWKSWLYFFAPLFLISILNIIIFTHKIMMIDELSYNFNAKF